MKILQNIVKSILLMSFMLFYSNSYAAPIDHFEVTMSPDKAKVGETIDITIKAVDSDNNIVNDYKGSILVFSESDGDADFPNVLKENSYTFQTSDEGSVKFENAVKFQAIGVQDIHVYDLENDTIAGIAEVEISGGETQGNVDIEILSPENGITIGEDKVSVSGLTNKNYSVVIKINNEREIQTTSNGDGIFEENITGLKKGPNIIIAQILDSDGKVIGVSSDTNIRVESNKPRIKNIKITPEGELEPRQKFNVEIVSNIGLSEVSITINDVLITLEERGQGIYKAEAIAPREEGDYSVDIILKDEIGHKTTELGVDTITVKAKETIAPVNIEPIPPVEITPTEEPESEKTVEQFCTTNTKVTGLKLTKLKTKSILNWDSIKDTLKYNVYKKLDNGGIELIKTVTDPVFSIDITGDELQYDFFAIKPVCKGNDDTKFEGTLSDATKIQTGPELIVLGILSILFSGLLIFYRRKA